MLGLLSQSWLDDHGDCEVLLAAPAGFCNLQQEQVIARLPVHRVILSAASTYFSALLGPSWQQQLGHKVSVKLVLNKPTELVPMVALLKCIYTGEVDVTLQDFETIVAPAYSVARDQPEGCCCGDNTPGSLTWFLCNRQQLQLTVIKLADQFAVHGVMDVAVSNLTRLFSHQLEWSTIEAVIWMPPALSKEPRLETLRQLAVCGVKQRLGVLDITLSKPDGRRMLQSVPAAVLAAVLSCDTLTATSENTVLAAVDVWLAGPVAAELAGAQQSSGSVTSANGDAVTQHACGTAGVFCLQSACTAIKECCSGGSGSRCSGRNRMSSSCSSSSCSSSSCSCGSVSKSMLEPQHTAAGGCPLDAAQRLLLGCVRLPQCSGAFLAAAVEHMPWMCGALQHKGQELEWLQEYYRSDSEGRYQLAMRLIQQTISCPWQPKLRKALPAVVNISNKPGPVGTCTLLSQLRGLLSASDGQRSKGQTPCSSWQGAPYIPLSSFVAGGYCWSISLQTVPVCVTDGAAAAGSAAAAAGVATSVGGCGGEGANCSDALTGHQLAVSITCTPAWAHNLDSSSNADSRGGCGSKHNVLADSCSSAAAPSSAGGCRSCSIAAGTGVELGSACAVCRCLSSIAQSKATAAVNRHVVASTAATAAGAGQSGAGSHLSSSSCCHSCGSRWSAVKDVVVGVNVLAAPKVALLQDMFVANMLRAPLEVFVPCRLAWHEAEGRAFGLVPLDVSLITNSSNLVSSWACEPGQLPAGAVQPAVEGGLGGQGGGGDGRVVVGWQPEVWSRLAHSGLLCWSISVRVLND